LKNPRYTRCKRAEVQITTIVILLIALLVIAAVMMGTGSLTDMWNKAFGLLSGKHKDAQICDNYKVIVTETQLLDLIYYVKKGYCGGDRADDTFKFTIALSPTPSPGLDGIEFGTLRPTTTACGGSSGKAYFCGEHYCNLINYPGHPETNPVYLRFGDVEMVESNDCSYKEFIVPFEGSVEDQECIDTDKSDLVIMGPAELRQNTATCTMGGTAWWCTEGAFGWARNTVYKFVIKEIPPGTKTSGYTLKGWEIRRGGNENIDVFLCLTATK
jgi:hypothetical protein